MFVICFVFIVCVCMYSLIISCPVRWGRGEGDFFSIGFVIVHGRPVSLLFLVGFHPSSFLRPNHTQCDATQSFDPLLFEASASINRRRLIINIKGSSGARTRLHKVFFFFQNHINSENVKNFQVYSLQSVAWQEEK